MRARRLLAWALGALLLAEGVLRFGLGFGDPPLVRRDPATEYELIPARSYHRFHNEITVNRWGMRSRDHAETPAPGERRVLLVGDSVVYGNHLLDQADTIAAGLERALPGCDLVAMAAAASSWGPVNQLAFLERTGLLGAEAAAVVISAHDLRDVPHPGGGGVVPYQLSAPWGAIGDVAIAVWQRVGWRVRRAVFGPPPPPPPDPEHTPEHTPERRAARSLAALDGLLARLAAAGVPTVLYFHPTVREGRAEGRPDVRDLFFEIAGTHGVATRDMTAEIQGALDAGAEPYRDGIHPAAPGAALYARRMAADLAPHLPGCAP